MNSNANFKSTKYVDNNYKNNNNNSPTKPNFLELNTQYYNNTIRVLNPPMWCILESRTKPKVNASTSATRGKHIQYSKIQTKNSYQTATNDDATATAKRNMYGRSYYDGGGQTFTGNSNVYYKHSVTKGQGDTKEAHSPTHQVYQKCRRNIVTSHSAPESPAVVHHYSHFNKSTNKEMFENYKKNIGQKQQTKRQPELKQQQHLWNPQHNNQSSPSTFEIDEHYQHYYCYFYNRASSNVNHQNRNLKKNTSTNRKLPTHFMSAAQGHLMMNTKDVLPMVNGNKNIIDKQKEFMLNEKVSNNNVLRGCDNNSWRDIIKDNDNFHDVPDAYDNKLPFLDNKNQDDSFQRKPPHPKPKRQVRTRSESDADEYSSAEYDCDNNLQEKNSLNNNSFQVESKKQQLPPARMAKLPQTPKRNRSASNSKKNIPSVHRVLLYNTQSPRLPRKSQIAMRPNRSMSPTFADFADERREAGGQDLTGRKSPIVHTLKGSPPDKQTPVDKGRIMKNNDSDRSEDEVDDDDLDNVSNFNEDDVSDTCSDTEEGYRAYAYKLTHTSERTSSTQSYLSSQASEESLKNPNSVLVSSLFPNVPPYLTFSSNTKKGPDVPYDLYRILKWRVTNIMPKVVRHILANSGMRLLKKSNEWIGVWGKHLKSPCFKTIRPYQKINHLPGSFKIGRKDSCWKNLQKQMNKHSHKEFGFMPRTYIIPNDLNLLRKNWPKYSQRNVKWIIKPPASARGAGIRVVNRWAQIPKRKPLIVQKYIERPLLINGSKFDLRLYVLVTSINPLRVFMYHNGLARFASVKYSAKADTLNDRCMHLTNYSINKLSSNYSKNEDVNACHGHKWTIKSLWTYLANRGVRTDFLWEALRSLVLRTILAGENSINNMIRMNVESKYSCFELFGFDVLLDSDLIPWLLEVNISPSLHSELPLDSYVKAPLVQSVLNTALYNVPPKLTLEKQKEIAAELNLPPGTHLCYDKRLYINYLSREEKIKHNIFTRKTMENRSEYIDAILKNLTPDDVRCLITAEDELARSTALERIFPTEQTFKYLKYTETPRYYNRLLDAWETRYAQNRSEGIALLRQLCDQKYHLQVPAPPAKKPIKHRPRTLVVTRPTVLTPTTTPWALKWKNRNCSNPTRVKLNNYIKEYSSTGSEESSTREEQALA